MFKKILVVFAILLAASFGYAQETSSGGDRQTTDTSVNPSIAADQGKHIVGLIEKIDLKKNKIMVKDEKTNQTMEFDFNETTTFNHQDMTMRANDLKKGQRIAFDLDDNKIMTKVVIDPQDSTTAPETQKPDVQPEPETKE